MHAISTEVGVAAPGCSSRGAWLASPPSHFPLRGQGVQGGLCCRLPSAAANTCARCLPCRRTVCPSSPLPSSCSSFPFSQGDLSNACADCRCSGCFPDCPGTGQPALLPQYLGSQIHDPLESSQVHPALRKPSRNKVHICEADSYGAKCLYPAQRPF